MLGMVIEVSGWKGTEGSWLRAALVPQRVSVARKKRASARTPISQVRTSRLPTTPRRRTRIRPNETPTHIISRNGIQARVCSPKQEISWERRKERRFGQWLTCVRSRGSSSGNKLKMTLGLPVYVLSECDGCANCGNSAYNRSHAIWKLG
jgi:hypothetical protein